MMKQEKKISSGSEEVQELAASTMRSLKTFDSDAKMKLKMQITILP